MMSMKFQGNLMGEIISSFKNFSESTSNAINGIAQMLSNVKTEVDMIKQFRKDQGNLKELIDVIRDNYADQVIKIHDSVRSLAEVNTTL